MHSNQLNQYLHLIIFDTPSPDGGGIQNMAYWLANSLQQHGLRTAIAGKHDYLERIKIENKDIDLFKLKHPFRTRHSSDLRLLFLLLRLRLHYGKKVILYSMVINNIRIFRWLKPVLGWHAVSFLHGNETLRLYHKRPQVLKKNLLACDCIIANSHYTKNIVQRIQDFPNVHVVHPGIPAARFRTTPDQHPTAHKQGKNKKTILILSRLVKRKGHQTIIQAVATLTHKHPDILLQIAGTGPYRSQIEHMVTNAGIDAHVQFLGFVAEADKPALYAGCDVFCMPSEISESKFDVEGFGITFIEAAAMGKIAIGTDSGGIPEAILDNETGFLIPHGDIDRLITLLDELLSRPADYEAIRQQARHRALDEFDWTSRMQKILEIETTHIPA